MKKSKFFSLSLMWEGIKQTKSVGICLTVISLIVACFNPFMLLLNGSEASFHAVIVNEFVAPIFSMFYFIPAILIFGLFGFLNKRNSSDFYHSVPLNRSCVYITYAATTMVWCIFIMLVSTFSSYILYSFVPNVMITPYFIWIALYSSFIAAFLAMSIALVAMGLSGNFFSDIVTFLLLMFAPRLIISAFTSALSSAVPIVSLDSIPLLRPYVNILFVPFESGVAYSELLTDWGIMLYSFVLAVIYFVGGFFIHRARKSESAESAVAFKGVRHVIRSLIGIVPTLFICYSLTSKIRNGSNSSLDGEGLAPIILLFAGLSIIAYFVYEFIATRSAKKLLYSIPLYLIVVAFDAAFIFVGQAVSNSIINTVPIQSDIQSVSVRCMDQNYFYEGIKPYQEWKAKNIDYENKELIKMLSDGLNSNVNTIKNGSFLDSAYNGYYSEYRVVFHCKGGNDISRKVYLYSSDDYNEENSEETSYNKISRLMTEDKAYTDLATIIPKENEVKQVYINRVNEIYSNKFTNDEINKIWHTFRNEYVSLSDDNKLTVHGNFSVKDPNNDMSMFNISIKGYIGVNAFYDIYTISPKFTPKTYKLLMETLMKYQEPMSSDIADAILSNINKDSTFYVYVNEMNKIDTYDISYDISWDNKDIVTAKDFENAAKAVKILTDAAQKDCDISKNNLYIVDFEIDDEKIPMQKEIYDTGGSSSTRKVEYIVNLTDEEYKEFCSIAADFADKLLPDDIEEETSGTEETSIVAEESTIIAQAS